jgi:hypothetical protein
MQYDTFKQVFNEEIFEDSKPKLLKSIAENPMRYIGLFRPTKPKAKIFQNLLQSHEISFGDAFEAVLEKYFVEFGYEIMPKALISQDGDKLSIDQHFRVANKVFFVEQKVRDDHDSTKKRGQINNFEKKLNELISLHGESNVVGIFYFIDPQLRKNYNFYKAELDKISKDYAVELSLFYGVELFDYLGKKSAWNEIIKHLTQWKTEIPDFPEINFDTEPQTSFEEIKDLPPLFFRNLLRDDEIYNNFMLTIFPENKTLPLLLKYFQKKSSEKTIYKTLAEMLENRLPLENDKVA